MTSSNRSRGGDAGRQAWTPEQGPGGVICPACGLANEAGARTCRNCGLPIASAGDPIRGVKPGRVDMPSTDRSGLSAAIGLALVVGLLLVGGTLAVSGGGILNSGGRLGVEAGASLPPDPPAGEATIDEGPGEVSPPDITEPSSPETADARGDVGLAFEYTCENGAIKDLGGSRWFLSQFKAGERVADDETYERITWEMSKRGKAKTGTTVSMEWTTPREARDAYGVDLVSGPRALVVTFDGPVDITAGQAVDGLSLEPEGVDQVRTIEMFEGEDGKVRTVVGIRGDSCARMSALGWTKKAEARNARIYLDVERL